MCLLSSLFHFSTGLTFFKIKTSILLLLAFSSLYIALAFLNLLKTVSASEQEIKSGGNRV